MVRYINSLINKLPPNKLVRVVVISAAIGASVLLLPFVIGRTGAWFAYTKITSPQLRYFVAGALAVLALFIGIPWTKAFFASEQKVTQTPVVEQTTAPAVTPKVETSTTTTTEEIAFESSTVDDPTLEQGKTAVKVAGIKGVKTLTWELTLTDGKETGKKLTKEEITTKPVNEVIRRGTKVAAKPKPAPTSNCDPNYSGCVPIDSDVDCAGGSGNGPSYVTGPIRVLGYDIYDLDRDGDGIACE